MTLCNSILLNETCFYWWRTARCVLKKVHDWKRWFQESRSDGNQYIHNIPIYPKCTEWVKTFSLTWAMMLHLFLKPRPQSTSSSAVMSHFVFEDTVCSLCSVRTLCSNMASIFQHLQRKSSARLESDYARASLTVLFFACGDIKQNDIMLKLKVRITITITINNSRITSN